MSWSVGLERWPGLSWCFSLFKKKIKIKKNTYADFKDLNQLYVAFSYTSPFLDLRLVVKLSLGVPNHDIKTTRVYVQPIYLQSQVRLYIVS